MRYTDLLNEMFKHIGRNGVPIEDAYVSLDALNYILDYYHNKYPKEENKKMRAKEIIKESYTVFVLDDKSKNILSSIFPKQYPEFKGDHITYTLGTKKGLPDMPESVVVIGHADDGESLEALVVKVNGTTERPDGEIYHITWTLDRSKGRKPMHSKVLVSDALKTGNGYKALKNPIEISVTPKIL